jgi:hypothetical protein
MIPSPSCRCAEGKGSGGVVASSRWRCPLLRWYYVDERNLADDILASAIFGRQGAPVQPPTRRPFIASATGARRILAAKWFVLAGLEVPSGGGSPPEEGFRATFPCSLAATP